MSELHRLLHWLDDQSCARHTGRAPGCDDCDAYGEITRWLEALQGLQARVRELEAALVTLAAFARTAPGRLPSEVQDAVDLVAWSEIVKAHTALAATEKEVDGG